MATTIYLAGGLFNAAERLHNLFLEKHLGKLGHSVILPQRVALEFFDGNDFDINGIVERCVESCKDRKCIVVANVDGPDADSGTAVEYGIAIAATGRAVVYRTDFRTLIGKELGINTMFKAKGTVLVYQPCFFTELGEAELYYRELARKIHEAVQKQEKSNRK